MARDEDGGGGQTALYATTVKTARNAISKNCSKTS